MDWQRGTLALIGTVVTTLLVVTGAVALRSGDDTTSLAQGVADSPRAATTGLSAAPSTVTVQPEVPAEPNPGSTHRRSSGHGSRGLVIPQGLATSLDEREAAALTEELEDLLDEQTSTPKTRSEPTASASPLPTVPNVSAPQAVSLEFVLSSFNVLGSSHTAPGGNKPQMADGVVRIRWAKQLLSNKGVDVVGFQEFQLNQQATFRRATDGRWGLYPGFSKGGQGSNNTIAWRKDTWRLVDAGTIPIPYFGGSRWPMPVVLLRNPETGLSAYFANFHNPASTKRHPGQARWRNMALRMEVRLARQLMARSDFPVFITGDFNEREQAFCAMTRGAPMVAAQGGSTDGPCRPPGRLGIDWIFGSEGVRFTDYQADQTGLVDRTTDHPMVVSRVLIEGTPQPR